MLLCAVLFGVTLWTFLPCTQNDFVRFDDLDYVTGNSNVQRGLTPEGLIWAMRSTEAANWHPLTWLSHMLDCEWFGQNPAGHHLTSVLLHAAVTALVFVVWRRMTGALWRSFFLAALFGLHPLRVESAAWVAERKDVLCAFFWMLATWAYVSAVVPRGHRQLSPKGFQWLAIACFALALLAKPMAVTFPFALLLLDFWPLGRCHRENSGKLVLEKWAYFTLSVASCVVTYSVQSGGGAVDRGVTLGWRVENAFVSCLSYLRKMFWPVDLAFFYPRSVDLPVGLVVAAVLLVIGVSAIASAQRNQRPFITTGWCWFLGTLAPVIGLVSVGHQAMADRYTYLPSLGIAMLTVWGVHELMRSRTQLRRAATIVAIVTLSLLAAQTRRQIATWKDTESLCRHAIAVTQNNHIAHDLLGATLEQRGLHDEAVREHREAIRLKPDYAEAYNNLGAALAKQNRTGEAMECYERALQLRPAYPDAFYNLGLSLENLGRHDEAILRFRQAIQLRAMYVDAHYNLGLALARARRFDEAIAEFLETVRLDPNAAEAHNNLGVILDGQGRTDEAIAHYQMAIAAKPDNARAYFNLGIALTRKGRLDGAIQSFEAALQLKPDYAEARTNLDSVLRMKNVFPPVPN